MAKQTSIDVLVLTALSEGPKHGYKIIKSIESLHGSTKISAGQLYPLLHKLEDSKLITSTWAKSSDGPDKKIYSLTNAGKRKLGEQVSALESLLISIKKMANV